MTGDEIGAITARLLFDAGAVHVSRDRPFILAAGWASPVYVDCRLLIGVPRVRKEIVRLMAATVKNHWKADAFDAVVGAETAGMPFASWLADALDLPLRYVRKRPLGIGHNAQVEGGWVKQLRVLLVDDLTTDGTSKLSFAKGLRAAGAVVSEILTIFSSSTFPGSADQLTNAGLTLYPLATWNDILRSDSGGRLDGEDRRRIEDFVVDPVGWSTRHGGRSILQPRDR